MARILRSVVLLENGVAAIALLALAALPVVEVILREVFRVPGIAAGADYMRHLTLWVALAAGVLTTRTGAHLSISSGLRELGVIPAAVRPWLHALSHGISVTVCTTLAVASFSLWLLAFRGSSIGIISIELATAALPFGFAAITARFVWSALQPPSGGQLATPGGGTAQPDPNQTRPARVLLVLLTLGGIPLGFLVSSSALVGAFGGYGPDFVMVRGVTGVLTALRTPLTVLILLSAFSGTPIFVVISGFALLQFVATGGFLEAVGNEAYVMLTQPLVPALPLFTLAGFILSESGAGERLIRVFRVFFGWFRGGLAVMVVLICAFFTTFTGASGVTILALGGVLVYMLRENGFRPRFAMGLLTAAGSIGLLFPPALPVIMYGVTAQIDIRKLFVGGFLPGVLMVATLAIYGVLRSPRRTRALAPSSPSVRRFEWREAGRAVRGAAWELALPLLVIWLFFGGHASLVETAGVAATYVLVVEVFITRDIRLKDLPGVIARCLPIIGGVLIILATAKGLAYYIVDSEAPFRLASWLETTISSKVAFLILLNLTLLVAGALMDIFSAIVVLGPLLFPLGASYGIHPVHLGIIFLANLELGYLTPPVGINLFLASYRFERGLPELYRSVVPFLIMLFVAVLLITYVPVLTTGLLSLPLFQF